MQVKSATLLLFFVALNTAERHSGITTIKVDKANIISGHLDSKGNLGTVYGLKQCGGPAKLIGWRMDVCDTTDSPCRTPFDTNIHSELEFIPSDDIEQLGIRVIYTPEGEEPKQVYEVPLENSSVLNGTQHTIKTQGRVVDENLNGRRVNAQYILYRVDSGLAEVCGQADLDIY